MQRRVDGFFDESGLAQVCRRARQLNDGDLARQLWIIRASLACLATNHATNVMQQDTGRPVFRAAALRRYLQNALAGQPMLLLLDEATSHLDAMTERRLDENLSGLHSTRIVIAHRLSTIVNADQIVVLADGEIVERGSSEELLAERGLYAALVESQMASA